jgi:hypothetical protein
MAILRKFATINLTLSLHFFVTLARISSREGFVVVTVDAQRIGFVHRHDPNTIRSYWPLSYQQATLQMSNHPVQT